MNKQYEEPAFPRPLSEWRNDDGAIHSRELDQTGMSLRDYFAAKAMQGILLSDNRCQTSFSPTDEATFFEIAAGVGNTQAKAVAWRAYQMADAMLKQRAPSPLPLSPSPATRADGDEADRSER